MNLFEITHTKRVVSLRDFVHAFFTELYNNKTVTANARQAYDLIFMVFNRVKDDAEQHNMRVDPNSKEWFYQNIMVPDFDNWVELFLYRSESVSKKHKVIHAATTHQYLLIGSNGAIEFHQVIGEIYMKLSTSVYQNNQCKTLILSKPGLHGKNVWGFESEPKEFFSKNEKTGPV